MTRSFVQRRSGFTLIEILIVIVIMTVIAGLAVKFLPNLNKNKGVPNGASQIEGWTRMTKSQALRDGAPRGIRLIVDPADTTRVTALQYIEQPEPLAPRGAYMRAIVTTPNPNAGMMQPPPYPNPMPTTVSLVILDPMTGMPLAFVSWVDQGAQRGDFFELTVAPFGIYQIFDIGGTNNSDLTLRWQAIGGKAVDGTDLSSLQLADGFRIIRSPRPLAGEPLLQLHQDIYIDLATSQVPFGISNYREILFNSSGQVANAPQGQYYLVVAHVDRAAPATTINQPNLAADHLIVVIYTRTGKISAVNWNTLGNDPYAFAKDGRGPGL